MRPLLLGLSATALSGFLYSLAFPPHASRAVAWVALVPFFIALRRVGTVGALFLAWFWAVFASSFVADALPRAVETYFLQPPLQSVLFAVFVWTITASVYTMAFAPVYRALRRVRALALPLLVAAAWTAAEFARGRLLTGSQILVGNPWALIAYSQVGWDELVQIAALTGVYGITFCVTAVNAALAEIVIAWWDGSRRREAVLGLPLALLPTLGALVYGDRALRPAPATASEDGVPIAVVQANLAIGSRWRSDFYGANLEQQLQLTRETLDEGSPRVVFWPESALTFFLEDEPLYRRALASLLGPADLELVVGGPRVEHATATEPIFFNSVFVVDREGEIRGRYDKQYLVPFSEYLPLRSLDFLRRRFERVRVFHHGELSAPLATRAGAAGVLVCNEAMYPEVARQRVLAGAEYLLNPSNDTWVQDGVWAERMFDLVSLRAVEQRRYLVRASSSGPSAIVDPWGRVVRRTAPLERATLLGHISPRDEASPYGRVGDLFAWACLSSVLAALAFQRGRGPTGV